eukprot:194994_1
MFHTEYPAKKIPGMAFLRTPESQFNNISDFPYAVNYISLPSFGEMRMAYIDEKTSNYIPGKSTIFLCLHGNPSWSYIWRKVIPVLLNANKLHNNGVRIICPDFIGFGRSDKPKISSSNIHTFEFHRNTIINFIKHLNLTNITLILQDWGAIIGLTLPMHFNTNTINRLILFNSYRCDGILSDGFLKWRKFSKNKATTFKPG